MAKFSITLDDEVSDFLTALSVSLGVSRSSLISCLLDNFCSDFKPYFSTITDSSTSLGVATIRARGESVALVEARVRHLLDSLQSLNQPDLPL